MSDVVTRFAPSPSGHLRVGGARTALYCWAFARGAQGRFVLRIEDTDRKRTSGSAAAGFMRDLDWLGIGWDEGPVHGENGGGDVGPYVQSERLAIYTEMIDRLITEEKAYYAFDTPDEIAAMRSEARQQKQEYRYVRGTNAPELGEAKRRIAAGEDAVVRLCNKGTEIEIIDEVLGSTTIPAGEIDDFVIRKADGYPTYHLAVVVDDALMNVSHVLRAQEHFMNTAKHMLLQDALGFKRPRYGHLSLIFNPDGSKMSKRDKDKTLRSALKDQGIDSAPSAEDGKPLCDPEYFSKWLSDKTVQLELEQLEAIAAACDVELPEINVEDFRRSGYLPQALCNFLALNGWNPGEDREKFDTAFLAETFSLNRVQKTAAKFDRQKLLAFNLDAIQDLSDDEFATMAMDHGKHYHPEFVSRLTDEQLQLLCIASHARSKTLDEPFTANRFLVIDDEDIEWPVGKPVRKAMFKGEPTGLDFLAQIRPHVESLESFDAASIESMVESFAEEHCEGNLGRVAQPLRIASCGGPVSPPIFDTLAMIGRESVLRRIDRCIDSLSAALESGS